MVVGGQGELKAERVRQGMIDAPLHAAAACPRRF
jgi:hypothetical protein